MKNDAPPRNSRADGAEPSANKTKLPLIERMAFTPGELAASCGKSTTWDYRRIYDGSVKAVLLNGRLLIPKAEIDRLLAQVSVYDGRPARAPKAKRVCRTAEQENENSCHEE